MWWLHSRSHTSECEARNKSTKGDFVSETNLNRTTECAAQSVSVPCPHTRKIYLQAYRSPHPSPSHSLSHHGLQLAYTQIDNSQAIWRTFAVSRAKLPKRFGENLHFTWSHLISFLRLPWLMLSPGKSYFLAFAIGWSIWYGLEARITFK